MLTSGSLFAVFADQLGIVIYVWICSVLRVVAGLNKLILRDDMIGVRYIGMGGC